MNALVYVLVTVSATLVAAPPTEKELPEKVRAILDKPDAVELYSLDAAESDEKGQTFHGYKVLGKVALKDGNVRKAVVEAVTKSVRADSPLKEIAALSAPWYGLRVHQGKKSVDLLINFRWGWMTAHQGADSYGTFALSSASRAAVDKLLQDAKIPIARGRQEEDVPSRAQALLEKSELVEVYSLEPAAKGDEKGERFHGYKVLGKVAIKDDKTRKGLIGQITPALVPEGYDMLLVALCFQPRHGLRMKYDGESLDLLICFECCRITVRPGGDEKHLKRLVEREGWKKISFDFALYECKGQPTFDKVLSDAGVPLAKKPKTE